MVTIDFNRLDIKPGRKILDIGCGEGRHTAEAFQHTGIFCVGADKNLKDLKASKKKLELHEAFQGETTSIWSLAGTDIMALPFSDNSFDVIICSEVLEHLPRDNSALFELLRVLKPGGILTVSVPRRWPEALCWLLSESYHTINQGHIRIYSGKKLIKKISALGTALTSSHHAHSLHSPYWWLKCLTDPHGKDTFLAGLYHKFLVWDLMEKPRLTRTLDRLLNPVMGKSLVLYFKNLDSDCSSNTTRRQ